MTKLKKTIAVIGEGITEKYYLKSLQGIIKADKGKHTLII